MTRLRMLTATVMCAGSLLIAAGCGKMSKVADFTSSGNGTTVQAEATVPIAAELTSPGAQRRTLPWDSVVLRATASLGAGAEDAEYVSVGTSPGLEAARALLRARAAGLADIATRLGGLPASEPAPGETVRPSVTDFSARRPEVEKAIRSILEDKSEQRLVLDEQRGAVLLLELNLRPVAEAVLNAGGGFSSSDPVSERYGARARAQEQAMAEVRSALAQQLLDKPARGNTTFREWLASDPMANRMIENAMQEARVIRSEEVPGENGAKAWFALMEYDYTELRAEAGKQLDKADSERKKADKASAEEGSPQ